MKKARILIIDRDSRYAEWLSHHVGVLLPDAILNFKDFETFERSTELSFRDCDLLLLGARFDEAPESPQSEGLELLRRTVGRPAMPPVIVVADGGSELIAVRALRLGAFDYLPKRMLTPQRLHTSVQIALRHVEQGMPDLIAGRRSASRATDERELDRMLSLTSTGALRNLIPGYTIRRVIGESDKAVVYLATSARLQRDVALKVSKSARDDANDSGYLTREYATVSAIRHPAVVEIYDYGVHEKHEYFAMEYFPRGDLKARLQQSISEREALLYVEHIALALRVLHHTGILHRDLKPPNVMLRDNEDVVLIDFGLARSVNNGMQTTQTGVLRGSPYYMSPEQVRGEELDSRTDIYSLGVILYEMLTGQKPYTGESAMEVLQQHVDAAVPELPDRLAHHQPLIAKLLAKPREERFADVEELLAALHTTRNRQSTAA